MVCALTCIDVGHSSGKSDESSPTCQVVSAAGASTSDEDDFNNPGATAEVSINGVDWYKAVVLTFDATTEAGWETAQTVFVRAINDISQEGPRKAIINHSILSDDLTDRTQSSAAMAI